MDGHGAPVAVHGGLEAAEEGKRRLLFRGEGPDLQDPEGAGGDAGTLGFAAAGIDDGLEESGGLEAAIGFGCGGHGLQSYENAERATRPRPGA